MDQPNMCVSWVTVSIKVSYRSLDKKVLCLFLTKQGLFKTQLVALLTTWDLWAPVHVAGKEGQKLNIKNSNRTQ